MPKFLQEYSYWNMHPFLFSLFQKYISKDKKILDVWSWSGAWWKRLLDNDYQDIYLIDGFLDPDIPFDNFIKSDFTKNLPYEDSFFDAISCLEVIEHVENRYLLINEMLRVLKKDGIIMISTPNIDTIVGKIFFFLTGNLIGFTKKDGIFDTFPAHINPFYFPSVLAYYQDKIELVWIYYSVWKVPFFGWNIPFHNRYFWNTSIYILRKK